MFISPPFGTWFNPPGTISIRGSYTLKPRGGLFGQIIKTLRYSFAQQGWVNKIGLRNAGIDSAIQKFRDETAEQRQRHITSIAIMKQEEIPVFLEKIPDNMSLEINVSCPNTEHSLVTQDIHKFLNPARKWCIVKLAPCTNQRNDQYNQQIDTYYQQGFRQFNCGNTYPVKEGGLSGITLIPYHSRTIRYIKQKYPDTVVIATGGIRNYKDVLRYRKCGADHISVSSVMFNPYLFYRLYTDVMRLDTGRMGSTGM